MSSLRAISRSLLAATVLFLAALATHSQNTGQFSINESPLPAPTGFVNDYAGVIDAATKAQIEEKIRQFKESSNPVTELAVAVVRTTGDRDIFDYSLAVARGWKIGSDQADNPGALLFVAIDDRKYFTQVSRDLEDELPDSLVGSLQRQYLVPEFKQGNYAKGISDTIDAYIRTINERRGGIAAPTSSPQRSPRTGGKSATGSFNWLCCIIIVGIILLILFSRRGPTGKDRDRWGGPGGGAASALPWIIGSILSSGGGSGRSSDWGGSSGGWGGGGFGGFGGGGDFGGGGSGGSW